MFIASDRPLEISSIDTIIEDPRNDRPIVLADSASPDSSGDIIVPAQFATPERINFMAQYGRRLICVALTRERSERLRLPPMPRRNGPALAQAFTVSIEAAESVTTGISVEYRAHTIAVAIDPTKGVESIVSPGHVFPLVARDGDVLVRAGHTEAAVDIARLAALNPAGVTCEVLNDDGDMARLSGLAGLAGLATLHNLRIGTIADLIAYRRRTETIVEQIHDMAVESVHCGRLQLLIYRNQLDSIEHIVLKKGTIARSLPTLVRMHQVDFVTDCLGLVDSRQDYIASAVRTIASHDGPAVVVFIRDIERGWKSPRYDGAATISELAEDRDYGVGALILSSLGVQDIILLSSSSRG